MFAQSVVEYGGVLGTLTAKLRIVTSTVGDLVSDAGYGTWLTVAAIGLIAVWRWGRSRK